LLEPLEPDDPAKSDSATSSAPHAAPAGTPDDLPRNTLVLQVGDSFAGSLGIPLGERFRARGLRSVLKFQTSSYVPTWASGTELPEYMAHYNPDLVLITLGANEFELSAPNTRAASVRRLVQRLGGRPCVWITPPRWKPDSGILAVIEANSRPCRFLDSDTVVHDLARKPDKIHPSDAAREVWADAVLSWLERERKCNGSRPWELRERGERGQE
jgi:lysophospholipase L1-like esterase